MSQDNKKSFVMYQGDGSNNVFSVPMAKGKYGTISVAFVRRGLDQYEYNPDTWGLNGGLFAWDLSGTKVYTDTATPAIGAAVYDQYGVDTGDTVTAVGGATITVNTNVYTRDTLHDVDENTVLTWTGDTLQIGDYIVIERTTTRTQPFEFQNNQKHIEKSDDNLERQIQEVADKVDNALLVDPTHTIDSNKMNPVEWMQTILRSVDKSVRGFRFLNGWLDYSLDDPNIADADKTWAHLLNTDNIKSVRERKEIEDGEEHRWVEYLDQNGQWRVLFDSNWDARIEEIKRIADEAEQIADEAKEIADEAKEIAEGIDDKAQRALDNSEEAQDNASEALSKVDAKQDRLTSENAGVGIAITEEDGKTIISNTQTSAEWGKITGPIENQTDLKNALDGKQNTLESGTSIKTINGQSVLGAGNITVGGAVESVNGKTGAVVLAGEDISADVSELTDTVQGHLQTLHDNIKDIELFKFPNATIIGEPIIDHGQVSGFSESNYLQFPFIVDLHNQPFVIDFCFTTGNDVTTQQNVLDSQFGLALAIANGRGLMAISHNGTSWAGSVTGTMAIQPNTTYYARLSWNRINYKTELSTDGTTYTSDMTFSSTQSPYPRTMFIGGCSGSAIGHTAHPFGGTINLNYSYLTVAGNVIWQGMDDAGLATRADVSLDNLDEFGQAKFDAKQNKLVAGENITIDEDTNTISSTGGADGESIKNQNADSEITKIYNWVGTLAEYQAQNIETLHPDWICYITDDTSSGGLFYNIGDTFMTKRTDTNLAGAVECDGATYNTTDFTGSGSIGELLEAGKLDYISLSAYSTAIAQTGWCDKIGWDGTGNTQFRVPTINPRHYIIKSQEPTAENNYTWYILYADGRVEQGGQYLWNNTSCPNRVSITYPIPMANAVNPLFITRPKAIGDTGAFNNDGCESQNATGFISAGYSAQNDRSNSFVWQVSGMSSITPQTNTRVMIQIANGATDEALETCTSVLSDVAGLKDMSNITATGKETVVGWGMPDYSAGISVGTSFTASSDGLVIYTLSTVSGGIASVNNVQILVKNVGSNYDYAGVSQMFYVSKGDIVNIPVGGTFYPLKGVN